MTIAVEHFRNFPPLAESIYHSAILNRYFLIIIHANLSAFLCLRLFCYIFFSQDDTSAYAIIFLKKCGMFSRGMHLCWVVRLHYHHSWLNLELATVLHQLLIIIFYQICATIHVVGFLHLPAPLRYKCYKHYFTNKIWLHCIFLAFKQVDSPHSPVWFISQHRFFIYIKQWARQGIEQDKSIEEMKSCNWGSYVKKSCDMCNDYVSIMEKNESSDHASQINGQHEVL